MNIVIPSFCLVLCVFTKINGDEIATKINPLTTSNDAKLSDTSSQHSINPNVDKTASDQTTKEPKAKLLTPTKFYMKDFRVTTLKSNHNDEDDCLATADPAKIEAVRKSLKSVDGKIAYTKPLNQEELKIAECLKKEYDLLKTQAKSINASLDTVEEVPMKLKGEMKGRRDTEYQFDPLEYYDETVTFDPSACPDDVEVIDLEISELKHYDVECELLTYWLGLSETLVSS